MLFMLFFGLHFNAPSLPFQGDQALNFPRHEGAGLYSMLYSRCYEGFCL